MVVALRDLVGMVQVVLLLLHLLCLLLLLKVSLHDLLVVAANNHEIKGILV